MSAHPNALRSKFNNNGTPLKSTPSNSPFTKTGTRSPRKANTTNVTLSLQHVVGTTTTGPNGFSYHADSDTYAYCAGSATVLAKVEQNGQVSQRFYKARPTASSINPCASFYEPSTPTSTPRSSRKSLMLTRSDGYGAAATASPFREWGEENTTHTWTSRERIKAASSVSISTDGRLLAVGETGYNPRVLLFSTATDDEFASLPLSIMSEHTFGVRAVAFSPDSRYLATLGDVNDGFLFMWAVNPKNGSVKLHSANRCTTNIYDMVWCGNALITVGTRHVKVWRVQQPSKPSPSKRARLRSEDGGMASPAPQTLSGRNVLLGALVDETFTCAVAVSFHETILCTESGYICLLNDFDGKQELRTLKRLQTGITSITLSGRSGQIVFGQKRGLLRFENLEALKLQGLKADPTASQPTVVNTGSEVGDSPSSSRSEPEGLQQSIKALGSLSQNIISLDGDFNFRISKILQSGSQSLNRFLSHHGPVKGLQLIPKPNGQEQILTWCGTGQTYIWSTDARCMRSEMTQIERSSTDESECDNELKVLRYISELETFLSGDRFGVLKLIKAKDWTTCKAMRAHGAEISDIAVHEIHGSVFVATCGRDRMVQLFRASQDDLELVQTLDEHIGAATQVLFTESGDRLLSASADRTIVIRDRISKEAGGKTIFAYLSSKVVTLKSTPVSMAVVPHDSDCIVVSTMDRHILKISISTGTVSEAFKVADPENDDTVVLSSICLSKSRVDGAPRLLVGYSSTDKSVRVYDFDRDILLTREFGHTEGISDVILREEVDLEKSSVKRSIISTGLDGTIMIWKLTLAPPQPMATPLRELSQGQALLSVDSEGTPIKPNPTSLPPLRKVLTNLDVAQFSAVDALTGSPVQASLRNISPSRLGRRTSRLTLAHSSIDEDEVTTTPTRRSPTFTESRRKVGRSSADSPSPPRVNRLQTQRSRPELKHRHTTFVCKSPSPSGIDLPASPSTPQHRYNNVANNSKPLRRPPSVPTDLRGKAMRQMSRRRSVGNFAAGPNTSQSDFGSLSMASEQVSRMLKTYRKRLMATKEETPQLKDVAKELETTLKAVRDKITATKETVDGKVALNEEMMQTDNRTTKVESETDVESLTLLLEQTKMAGNALQGVEGVQQDD